MVEIHFLVQEEMRHQIRVTEEQALIKDKEQAVEALV